jgi:soluble lytic murein transglycosylase
MTALALPLALFWAAPVSSPRVPAQGQEIRELDRGQQAFWAGQYERAARTLAGLERRMPRVRDHVLYLAAESELYAGRPARARELFSEVAAERDSRFAPQSPWRVADCLWAEGRKDEAAAAYRRLLAASVPAGVDPVVARFHVAEQAPAVEAGKLFRQIHVDSPAHPLAIEASRLAGPADDPSEAPAPGDPRARLRRAAVLLDRRHVDDAIRELEGLPRELPPELAVERDLALGMAKFRTRHDYPQAAELLLSVAPKLTEDRAASAAFHGARALARANRTDESIAANRRLVETYSGSRWATEAQFVIGWLEFNRGHYRECQPELRALLSRRNPFADDASWYLALAHHFLGEPTEALAALDEFARLAGNDADAARRVAYWRGRFLLAAGKKAEARAAWRDLVRRQPLSYYGLLATARLRQLGETVRVSLPKSTFPLPPPNARALHDPVVVRADELASAGLAADAGIELQRGEDALEGRLGRERALPLLLDRYRRYGSYRRAFQLAETRGALALQAAPVGPARAVWEAAHPRAFQPLVERYGQRAKAPPLFVWSIMQKETEFGPYRTSPADARGLLQVLPELGAELSGRHKVAFYPDELYRPEVNIRLGTERMGALVKAFRGQLFLVAGAYNGGVDAVGRWVEQHGRRPLDEFMELVGFRESREYMKRVTAIYAHYVYLYTGKVLDLPLGIKRIAAAPRPRREPPPPTDEEPSALDRSN